MLFYLTVAPLRFVRLTHFASKSTSFCTCSHNSKLKSEEIIKKEMIDKVFLGQIIHTKSFDEFEIYPNGFVALNENGIIVDIGNNYANWKSKTPTTTTNISEIYLGADQFLMPGFVDCHIHAPQVPQIGLGLDMELLDWLQTYTFPLEAKFADVAFASKVYKNVVETTIRCGTTLASYFGSNDKTSTLVLANEAKRQGQRALIGKVCSDRNSPDFYVEKTDESVAATKEFIQDIANLESDLIKPTVTPRFAVSCTEQLLMQLGDIARENNLHIQSHISENISEVEFVKSLFPNRTYAQVYEDSGLLTNKTIMAHGVHLEDSEIDLLKTKGTSVAHCPASNTMLSSGFCDVIHLIKNGVTVGLGTDVSGGNSMSIQDAILRALDVSHHLEFVKKQIIKGSKNLPQKNECYKPINYKQAIYLATLGGAQALAMDNYCGNFVAGKAFDALLIDTSVYPLNNYETISDNKTSEEKLIEMVQRFIYVGDDRNILKVYVAGKQIKRELV